VKLTYPASLRGIGEWAASNRMRVAEAKFRFAQYGILQAVADSRTLSQVLAFKGGNALDFVWQPNRSTRDLDFSSSDSTLTAEQLRTFLTPSLGRVSRSTGILYRVQKMEQQPPGPDRSFITFEGKIGYALSDDRRNRQLIQQDKSSNATVPLAVSLNDPICGIVEVDIASSNPLHVCQLEDIVAEKLRALLQQPLRNRRRRTCSTSVLRCNRIRTWTSTLRQNSFWRRPEPATSPCRLRPFTRKRLGAALSRGTTN
jgi:hypothetical protein